MDHKSLNFWKRIIAQIRGITVNKGLRKRYEQDNYLEAYSRDIDLRVKENPHAAVGGMWEEIGKLQYEFLISKSLLPCHKMLDIGCGTLRGGRHFIRYLQQGNYTGFDISAQAIEYAKRLVQKEELVHKRPRLIISENKDLQFKEFKGEKFDFVLAQSVFTHLMPENIEECLQFISTVMHERSVFFFTFRESQQYRRKGFKDFAYPFSFFDTLAERYDLHLDRMSDYHHPREQQMVRLTIL